MSEPSRFEIDHLEGKVAALDWLMCFTWYFLLLEMEEDQRTTLVTRLQRMTERDFEGSRAVSAEYIKGYKRVMDSFSAFALEDWLPPPIEGEEAS